MKPDYISLMEQGFQKHEGSFYFDDIQTAVYLVAENAYIIDANTLQMNEIYNIYKFLVNKGLKVLEINLHTSDFKDVIGMTMLNLNPILKIKKHAEKNNLNTDIMIEYDNIHNAELDDYLLMAGCIKWYRDIIEENKLSPFEKLMYAYDIAKTYKYTRSGKSSKDIDNDNTLHLIIKTGNIVCLGYNRLMKEILNGIDPNLRYDEFTTYCYANKKKKSPECHSRGIVRIDDDKYNIHGIYICDPTWDSVRESLNGITGYSSFSGYRFFMVPISKYRRFFKGDTYPRFFNGKLYGYEKRLTKEQLDEMEKNPNIINKHLNLMEGIDYFAFEGIYASYMTYKDLIKYLNCDRPYIEDFVEAIIKVRKCEGFSVDNISESLVYGIDVDDKNHGYYLNVEKENQKQLVL